MFNYPGIDGFSDIIVATVSLVIELNWTCAV